MPKRGCALMKGVPLRRAPCSGSATPSHLTVDAGDSETLRQRGAEQKMIDAQTGIASRLAVCSASRLNQWCEVLGEAAANRIIHVHRGTRVQKERADRLLLHLFQHQIHHRGQAHAMLSGNVCAAATTRRILLGRRGTVARGRIQRAWIDRGNGLAGARLLDHMSPVAPRHITERGHGEVRC